jgi:hypothetical protein
MSLTYCVSIIDVIWKISIRPCMNGECPVLNRLPDLFKKLSGL